MTIPKNIVFIFILILPCLIKAQVMPVGFFQNRATNIADNGSANALDFDGINDHVITTLNADVSVMPVTTWEAWVYPTKNNGDWQMIVGIEDTGWDRFIAINNGAFHMGYGGGGWQAVAADMNQWQHIAVVYNEAAGFIKFYKNGVAYSFTPGPFSHTSNVKFSIGCSQQGSPGQFYQGRIDDVRVWTVERTQAQIQANMNIELLGTETGLKAYYTFNQGIAGGNNAAITTVTDKTANALNGALTNFAKTGSSSNFVLASTSKLLIPKSNTYGPMTTSGTFPLNPSLGGGNISFLGGPTYEGSNQWGPHQLFDNIRTSADWCNNGSMTHFGQFTFPKPVFVSKIFIVPRASNDNFPASVTLKVDGVTIGTYTTKNISTNDGLQINYSGVGHFITPNVSGTVWRLEFSVANVYIGELEFLGF